MTELHTTTWAIQRIRDLQHEQSALLDRLMEARQHIASLQGLMQYAQQQARMGKPIHIGETICESMAAAQAFMDAGLFGDRVKSEPSIAVGVGTYDANGNPKGSGWA